MFFHATLTIDYIAKRMWHLCSLEKKKDTWHNLSQKRLSLAVFHNFDACDASCRVFPWCEKHYLSVHFESGQLNSRGDVLRRSSQCWHLTDIHQLHNANADWLAAPPLPPRLCCRSVRKFRSFTVTFSLKHKASRRNASTDTWNWTSSGQVFIAALPDVFSSVANTTVTVFFDLWESCVRSVGRNNRRR